MICLTKPFWFFFFSLLFHRVYIKQILLLNKWVRPPCLPSLQRTSPQNHCYIRNTQWTTLPKASHLLCFAFSKVWVHRSYMMDHGKYVTNEFCVFLNISIFVSLFLEDCFCLFLNFIFPLSSQREQSEVSLHHIYMHSVFSSIGLHFCVLLR